MNRARLTVVIGIFCISVGAANAQAEGSIYYGLLRMRDLSPFGFLRLDMRPAHAVSIEKGSWAVEFDLGYQNTWALSKGVEDYLTSIEPQGRHALGPADLQAIRELPGENYLVDSEVATLDAIVHYKLTDSWTSYVILSGVSYQGGFLDSTIESFHETLGFSTFGRPAANKNDVNLIYDLKSAQIASFGSPTEGGILDPTLGVRYAGISMPSGWSLSFEGAVKIPIDGARPLVSTGHYDYGVQASVQRRSDHHALYANVAAVYYGGASFPVPQESQIIPTFIVGYEHRLTAKTNVNAQLYASTSTYSHASTDLDELTSTKYQYSIGMRHRIANSVITIAITENVQNINNTPDIGFQLGFAYVPHPRPRR
jgi:hypothetical protein